MWIIIDPNLPKPIIPEQGSINDAVATDYTTYSSEKIEAINTLKMDKEVDGATWEILIKDASGNAQASWFKTDDFALSSHNHDASEMVLSTVNFGWVLDENVDTIQKLADWIDDTWLHQAEITAEIAQDAVGNILTDTDSINFAYNDSLWQITADVKDGSITSSKLSLYINNEISGKANDASVLHKTWDEAFEWVKISKNDFHIWQQSANVPTWLRAVSQSLWAKNDANSGWVHFSTIIDADWTAIWPRKMAIWWYPHKTSDGSVGGYEEFLAFSFPTYDWNTSYTKMIELNANIFAFKNWYVGIGTTNPAYPLVVSHWENNWEISARIGRVSFIWENTGGLAGGISSEGNWFWLGLYSPSGTMKFYVWGKTTNEKKLEINAWGLIYGTEWQTEFFYWPRSTLLSSQVDMWYRFRDSTGKPIFRMRTANNDVAVEKWWLFRKDIDTGWASNTLAIWSRYEFSGITHVNQWHKIQFLWGDIHWDAENWASDWGWGLMFWSNNYKFLELINIAGSNRVFVWNHNQNNCFVIRWDANDTNAHNLLNGEPNKTMIVTQSWQQVFFYWKDYNGSKWKATVTGTAF